MIFIASVIATSLLVLILIFLVLTRPITYSNNPDTSSHNRDKTNTKQRPFVVDKKEYPFESNWFERDSVSMHYLDEGEGIPVLMCHGNPEWSFIFRDVIKELSGEVRLIAYDLPGFGFSDTPADYSFTPQEHVEWINALVFDHLKLDKFIIVVQDWGGPIGLTIAANNPDHIYGVVASNTWAWKNEGPTILFSYLLRTPIAKRLIINKNYFATSLMQKVLNEESANKKAITDAYALPFPTPESRRGTAEFPRQISVAAHWLEKLEGRLNTLSEKPVELVFGLKDYLLGIPKVQEKWLSHFPDANVQKRPNASHFTQEDSPDSFVIAIRNILKKIEPAG